MNVHRRYAIIRAAYGLLLAKKEGTMLETEYKRILEDECAEVLPPQYEPAKKLEGGVYFFLEVFASDMKLRDPILLEGGYVIGAGTAGTVHVPYGVMVVIDGPDITLEVQEHSYEELLRMARGE